MSPDSALSESVSLTLMVSLIVILAAISWGFLFGFESLLKTNINIVGYAEDVDTHLSAHAIRLFHQNGDSATLNASGRSGYHEAAFTLISPTGMVVSAAPSPLIADHIWQPGDSIFFYRDASGFHVTDSLTERIAQIPAYGPFIDLEGGIWTVRIIDTTIPVTINSVKVLGRGSGTASVWTITASNTSGGSISPNGPVSVNDGSNKTFTMSADAGYHITDVLVDGISKGAIANYPFSNVKANHTIAVSFAKNSRATIFYDGFEDGTQLIPSSKGWTVIQTVNSSNYDLRNGNKSVRLRYNGSITRTISTATHSEIVVQFAWAAKDLDTLGGAEYAWAKYSTDGGSSWTTLSQIGGTSPSLTNYVSSSLPAAADHNSNFALQFWLGGSSNNDYANIDDVRVTGIPDTV